MRHVGVRRTSARERKAQLARGPFVTEVVGWSG